MSTSSDRRLPRHTEHISQARQLKTQHSKKGGSSSSSSKNRRTKGRPASAPVSNRGIFVPRPAREGAPAVNMQPPHHSSKREEELEEAVQGLSNKVLQELQRHRHLLEGIPQQLFRAEVRAELRGSSANQSTGGGELLSRRGYDVEAKTSASFGSGVQSDQSVVQSSPLPQDLVRRLSEAFLHNAAHVDAVRQRVEEVADAQQQALATASHNKTVLDGVSKDFYKLLLEQIAWIMVELKVAKADRAAVAADAATSISSSNGAHHHHGNVSDEPNNSRAASRSSALLPTRNNGTTSSSGGGNLSVRAVQSIEAKLDNVQTAHEKLARTQQSHHRRLLDAVAGLADSGNMKIMTSELMSNLIAQIEDVSKTVRRLGNGQGGSTSRGRVSDARAAEVKAKDALEETKRLVSSFNEHIVRQHQDIKREIKANRWTMEATAKSFEKALTFHLGIIHESGVSLAASGGAIEANEPTFSPTGSGHGTPRGATNSRGVFGQPVASDAAESSNAARHALLFGNAGSSSPSRRRSHSPVDLAIAAGGIDDMASEHSEPGQEHHDDVLDNGAAKGYRYEPPQLRNPKPSTGIGHAQAKVLQASVLKSTSYLQRLEEVTEERVKMLDRGEFVTETTFDKRMQQMLDRLENLEKAVIANIETQTQVSANVRTRARAPQHSRRTAPGTGRSRTPQPQQSDDDFNSPRAADAHAIREQKTQQDSHERTAQQESKMQDPQHAAEPFVPSAAMESVAAAAAAAADTASSAASKAARAADEASSATTEGISAALAAAAAAREASAAAASAAEAAQASASAVRDLSQRIHALANSVASIGRNQDGVQKMLSDTLRAVTRL